MGGAFAPCMEGNSLETFQFEREDLERAVQEFLRLHGAALLRAARETAASLSRGGKVLFFGNGGSAAEAQHLSAELVNRMTRDRPALAAVALSTDTSALTSIANDSSYEQVFSRQIEALGKSGDVAVALSTSGNSPNIVRGLEAAKRKGLLTVALLGRDGGLARALAEIPLVVEAPVTARIQEVHLFAGHLFCEAVERVLFPALRPPD
ncbi:MAG: D-sedoheptulose 7-phosphate isomerase [Acidobacteria bacterium]|nr:D-sedoheptulose 7-phosphate isomerase [Acidobacteriota bacterium]